MGLRENTVVQYISYLLFYLGADPENPGMVELWREKKRSERGER